MTKTIIECATGSTMPSDAEPTDAAQGYGCNACEYIQDNQVHRCSKFITMTGQDPQDGNKIKNESRCKDAWDVLLKTEESRQLNSLTAATESMRNSLVARQDAALTELLNIIPPKDSGNAVKVIDTQ